MICKHFNLSWIDLRDDIDLYNYYTLLAEAQDAEELEDYNTAAMVYIGTNNPKQLKKWKWSSKDRAGTKPLASTDPLQAIMTFAAERAGGLQASGNGLEYAKATGRPVAYMDKSGNLFDENGRPTEQTALTIIIKMDSVKQ